MEIQSIEHGDTGKWGDAFPLDWCYGQTLPGADLSHRYSLGDERKAAGIPAALRTARDRSKARIFAGSMMRESASSPWTLTVALYCCCTQHIQQQNSGQIGMSLTMEGWRRRVPYYLHTVQTRSLSQPIQVLRYKVIFSRMYYSATPKGSLAIQQTRAKGAVQRRPTTVTLQKQKKTRS